MGSHVCVQHVRFLFFSVKTWVWQIYIEFQSFLLCLAVLILDT